MDNRVARGSDEGDEYDGGGVVSIGFGTAAEMPTAKTGWARPAEQKVHFGRSDATQARRQASCFEV